MKKIFSLVISVVLLFSCTSCVWLWMADQTDQYKEYPLVELNVDNATVIYNGMEYIACGITSDPNWSHRDGFRLNGEKLIVAKELSVSVYSPIYVSIDDIEQNLLVDHSGFIYAAKKDFTLPHIEKNPLSSVFIQPISSAETEGFTVLDNTNGSIYLRDFMSFEMSYDISEGKSKRDGLCGISCVFEEYQYLRWIFMDLAWIDGEIFCIYTTCGETASLESGYYKVTPEYQEVFKTAIKELNEMQS